MSSPSAGPIAAGQLFRADRESAGVTAWSLARRMGCELQDLIRFERGEVPPDPAFLFCAYQALADETDLFH